MSAAAPAAAAIPAAAPARAAPRFLPEIQGLRTIALLLVATFHIWLGRVSGGVDIFLLISAYLLTRSLAARAEAGELTRPVTFIVRKFARLLPAAAAVIALTVIAGLMLLAPRFWPTLLDEALAALTYTTNFRLQAEAVDYYAASRSTASVFQHFWSLAIQGQVFLLWPLLHLAAELAARLLRLRVRRVLLAGFALLAAVSFWHAVRFVEATPELAYFDTRARLWEFAAGSLLALLAPLARLPLLARRAMTWAGIAGAVSCGFVLPVEGTFPGWAALWPVASAALVIIAAEAAAPDGSPNAAPDPIIGHRWLRIAGEYTYALYLVHWPALILHAMLTGQERPSPLRGLAILVGSAALAAAITLGVDKPAAALLRGDRPVLERPSLRWTPRIGYRTIAVLGLAGLIGGGSIAAGANYYDEGRAEAYAALTAAEVSRLGPRAGADAQFDRLIPDELIMADQLYTGPDEACDADDPYLSPGAQCHEWGPDDAEREILVVGNSHAIMYTGFVMETAEREASWSVRAQAAPGCAYGDRAQAGGDCAALWDAADRYIRERQPDLVVMLGTMSAADGPDRLFDEPGAELAAWAAELRQASPTRIVAVRDVPRFPFNAFECASTLGYESEACTAPASPEQPGLRAYADGLERAGAIWVDFDGLVCPGGVCRPSQGGLVTYYDSNHLTDVYSRSLAQAFADQLGGRVEWWPSTVWPESAEPGEAAGDADGAAAAGG